MSSQGTLGSISPADFARTGESLAGTVEAGALSRLREQMAGDGEAGHIDRVNYAVAGRVTERGHDALVIELSGEIGMNCQRCLEPVRVPIASRRRIIFAAQPDAVDAEYDSEDTDVVEPEAEVDVETLIEDEILLSLPLAPMHETGVCQAAGTQQVAEAASPFAALAQWGKKTEGE